MLDDIYFLQAFEKEVDRAGHQWSFWQSTLTAFLIKLKNLFRVSRDIKDAKEVNKKEKRDIFLNDLQF